MDNQATQFISGVYQDHFNQFTPCVFQNQLFGNLTVLKDNNTGLLWFVGKEVAEKLGYQDPKSAIRDLVAEEFKLVIDIKDLGGVLPPNPKGGNQKVRFISEYGLHALITKSTLHNSLVTEFQHWLYGISVQMRQYGIAVSDEMKIVMDIDPYQVFQIAQQRLKD